MTDPSDRKDQLEVLWLDPLAPETPLDQWQDLADNSVDPNPFFTPGFLQPFLQAFPSATVRLLVIRAKSSEDWRMAAPIRRRRAGLAVPIKTTWTSYYAPLGTPLLRDTGGPDDVAAFVRAGAGSANLMAMPFLPCSSRVASLAEEITGWESRWAEKLSRAGHSFGDLGEVQYKTAMSGKRRKEMRRQLRRLEDHGPIRIAHLMGEEAIEGFEEFMKLEAEGWKGRAGTALSSNPETALFSRNVIKNRSLNNGVRIDQLWAGDTLIASLILFIEGAHVFSWKIAFNETFARMSPGAQIAAISMKQNLQSPDILEADSLAVPGHSMIEPLWRGRVDIGTLVLSKGPLGSSLASLTAVDLKLERSLRSKAKALKAVFG
ncbi:MULTISPECIES: GNAT family N-acetyltransferase [unclassified Roseibium]|uniref:GNAT family N-acetyltransferase n=1 Tax=unclassified Roseibium TaxID=2629323 RepID=UPI00273D2BA2|nr:MULTISPECIES: GNAT family N-acetyltransferase [unclassified Roseibium]